VNSYFATVHHKPIPGFPDFLQRYVSATDPEDAVDWIRASWMLSEPVQKVRIYEGPDEYRANPDDYLLEWNR
jgi:hypothetical protein